MRVSIFGLGYVGAVCTASLAQRGHHVVGVDVSPIKIDLINSGRSPIVEPGLEELLAEIAPPQKDYRMFYLKHASASFVTLKQV